MALGLTQAAKMRVASERVDYAAVAPVSAGRRGT